MGIISTAKEQVDKSLSAIEAAALQIQQQNQTLTYAKAYEQALVRNPRLYASYESARQVLADARILPTVRGV
jgi:hypothetical protein